VESWQLKQYGGESLWAKSRGATVRVAVLDAAVSPSSVLPASRLKSLDHRGRPGPLQTSDHGHCCAALIGAEHPTAPGIAPECEIVSIAVETTAGPNVGMVTRALRLALEHECDVISCSFVLPTLTPGLRDALRDAHTRGVPVVAAGGNTTALPSFPHRARDTVVVGSLTRSQEPMTGTPSPFVDVYTWGEDLDLPDPSGARLPWLGQSSGATALTAALIALALAPLPRPERRRRGPLVEGFLKFTAQRSTSNGAMVQTLDAPRFIEAIRSTP
jgi:hypothetical protein